ncbi:hypothetical protein [Azoarcus taiwanensis]|uniref:hypothetical protein n=1 Tax=Azoarcus taiwanensis TaxID=666964 RepID=UPI001B7D1928|nr:hypothetical protein [Azoarcus taiwanensis]
MIVVDSSVWVDFFRGVTTPQTERLDDLLGSQPLAVGDLILAEVLQGFSLERDFNQARRLFSALDVITLGGEEIAVVKGKRIFPSVVIQISPPGWVCSSNERTSPDLSFSLRR